jgi:hypothetical protein
MGSQEQNPIVPGLKQSLSQIDLAVRTAIEGIYEQNPISEMVELHAYIGLIKKMVKQWDELAEKKFVAVLIAHGGPEGPAEVNVGNLRYYVGTEKKVTPRDNADVLEALLLASNGDVSTVVEALRSDPWKPSQVRQIVGEAKHRKLFRTSFASDLRTGKPRKGLRCIDTRFLPKPDLDKGPAPAAQEVEA